MFPVRARRARTGKQRCTSTFVAVCWCEICRCRQTHLECSPILRNRMKIIAPGHAETVVPTPRPAVGVRTQILVEALVVVAICASLFAFVQFGTRALADNDAYYHVKMGRLIREQGL